MPDKALHLDQLRRNEIMATRLTAMRADPNGDVADAARQWEAVCRFYAAVHWVEAQLAEKGEQSGSHRDRNQSLRRHWGAASGALSAYADLRALADAARYDCQIPTDTDLTDAATDLVEVKQSIT